MEAGIRDSFKAFSVALERVRGTSGRNEKVDILGEYFKTLSQASLAAASTRNSARRKFSSGSGVHAICIKPMVNLRCICMSVHKFA
jgi:hypothetical protein